MQVLHFTYQVLTQTILFLVSDLFTFVNMEYPSSTEHHWCTNCLTFAFFSSNAFIFGKENPHTLKTSLFSCILTPKVNVLRYNFL